LSEPFFPCTPLEECPLGYGGNIAPDDDMGPFSADWVKSWVESSRQKLELFSRDEGPDFRTAFIAARPGLRFSIHIENNNIVPDAKLECRVHCDGQRFEKFTLSPKWSNKTVAWFHSDTCDTWHLRSEPLREVLPIAQPIRSLKFTDDNGAPCTNETILAELDTSRAECVCLTFWQIGTVRVEIRRALKVKPITEQAFLEQAQAEVKQEEINFERVFLEEWAGDGAWYTELTWNREDTIPKLSTLGGRDIVEDDDEEASLVPHEYFVNDEACFTYRFECRRKGLSPCAFRLAQLTHV
jgi:hypothetical protein